MREKIKQVLMEIRPLLQEHGGDLDFVDFDEKDGIVKIELRGGCLGCPMAEKTLKYGVEKYLKEKISAVKKVIAV